MAVDYETPVGEVRLLTSDVGGEDGNTFLFPDPQIEAFLRLQDNDVFMAAALALRTIAANEAQTLKAITVLELETDGSKPAKVLKELANDLERKSDEGYQFDIAAMGVDMFSRRELRTKRVEGMDQGWEE